MEKIKESEYHREWQKNRIKFILSKYPESFFNGKRILELGAFNGYIGSVFNSMGATVHCIEGRVENVNNIKRDYPNVSVELANLDTPNWIWGEWDIIINFGLYYHLEHYHTEHLQNCLDNCNLMFFESVIFDSNQPEIHYRNETGVDQSLGFSGGTPSTSYVEDILKSKNTIFFKYSSPELNGDLHHYDWVDLDSKILDQYARRFWIINIL
jgi:hypothetical protein